MAFRSVSVVASETSIITAEGHHRESGSSQLAAEPLAALTSESATQEHSQTHGHEEPTCRSRGTYQPDLIVGARAYNS
jgi:hypothetical protein